MESNQCCACVYVCQAIPGAGQATKDNVSEETSSSHPISLQLLKLLS